MSFSFNNLNLSGVSVSTSSLLKPGKYVVRISDAKVIDTSDRSGKRLELNFAEVNGGGNIRHYVNLHLPKSPKATEIGKGQLKTILHFGGHANPDHPGDVNTMKGLIVGIVVGTEVYNKDGESRTTSKVDRVVDPHEVNPAQYAARPAPKPAAANGIPSFGSDVPQQTARTMDDEIPF